MTAISWIVSSCVMIIAVLAIRALFGRRLRPGLRYALWVPVLVRLLIPGSLWTLPVSVESAASGTELARDLAALEDVEDLTLSPDGKVTGTPRAPAPAGTGGTVSPSPDSAKPAVTVAENVTRERYARMERTLTLRRAARIVWAAGSGVSLAVFAVTNVVFYVNLRRRRVRLDAEAPVKVYRAEGLESSCYFLGSIYVNSRTAEDGVKLRHVLAHELSHRRHGDGLWALLRCAALTVHWFDPLVWIAASASRQDSELCADAGALRTLGDDERESYGETLISLSVHSPRAVSPFRAATTMNCGKKALRARVELIARRPRATLAVLLAVTLIAGIAVGCAFAGSGRGGKGGDDSPAPAENGDGGETDKTPENGSPSGEDAGTQTPDDPNHYFYTGDGWTMEVPKSLGGEPLNVTVTTGDGGNYWYSFAAPDGSALTVYLDGYSTARERYDFMSAEEGATGDAASLTVTWTDEDGSTWEERYIDCPEGGHWEIAVKGAEHLEELREMSASFRVTPGTEPTIESDATLRTLFAEAELENMTVARVENGAPLPAVNAAGSPHGAEYLDILRSLKWADDLEPYEGEDPAWCVVLETPEFRAALNDSGWVGVTTAGGSFGAWIVNFQELSHETDRFGWEQLARWYDEAAAAQDLPGEPITAAELELWTRRLAGESYDREREEWTVSPVNGFFLSHWTDPGELDFGQFVAYFPLSVEIGAGYDEAERQAVYDAYREKFGEPFNGEIPIHAIRVSDVDAVLQEYAGIATGDLKTDWRNAPNIVYLPEYDTVYTFTSDYGPGAFTPLAGTREGDTLTLYSSDHVLTVRESGDAWRLLSHTPMEG